ncbi:MAG: hypothetical protein J7L07_10035, partial [Candidatus Odinarchaeota archaeon]|nr:hypothetical protein [Candidatus Odinarchaeota archaeon]
ISISSIIKIITSGIAFSLVLIFFLRRKYNKSYMDYQNKRESIFGMISLTLTIWILVQIRFELL